MNKCVHLFGGIGISQYHFRHAIEVYKSNNFKIHLYQNDNLSFASPHRFNKRVNTALKMDSCGHIIHTHSGGFWGGVSYQSKTTHNKLFICEGSPFENNPTKFIDTFEKMYHQKCPVFLRNCTNKYGKLSFKKIHPDWTSQLHTHITNIPNFVSLIGKNDNVVDWVYIDFIMNSIRMNNNSAKQYVFNSDNLSKRDILRYQDVLQNHINRGT